MPTRAAGAASRRQAPFDINRPGRYPSQAACKFYAERGLTRGTQPALYLADPHLAWPSHGTCFPGFKNLVPFLCEAALGPLSKELGYALHATGPAGVALPPEQAAAVIADLHRDRNSPVRAAAAEIGRPQNAVR